MILLLFIEVTAAQHQLPYPVIVKVGSLGEATDAVSVREFQIELEKGLNNYTEFFKIITTDFDNELLDALIRGSQDWTQENLNVFGNQELFKYIIKGEINVTKQTFRTKWSAFIHLVEVETANKLISEKFESDKSLNNLAELCVKRVYQTMCTGKVIIRSDPPEAKCYLNEQLQDSEKGGKPQRLKIGEYRIQIQEEGYRSLDSSFVLQRNQTVIIDKRLRQKGQNIKIEGSPIGADITISGDKFKEKGKLPYQSLLPVGDYKIAIEMPGYISNRNQSLQIRDTDFERALVINLAPIQHSFFIKRSLAVVGWGQYSLGYKFQGLFMATGEFVSLLGGIGSQIQCIHLNNEIDDLYMQYKETTDAFRLEQLKNDIDDKENNRETAYVVRNISLGLFTGVYIYNLIDIWLIKGSSEKKIKKEPFVPDDSIFDNIKFNFSPNTGVGLAWFYQF